MERHGLRAHGRGRRQRHVVVGHVGDTRLYKLRRGHIEKLTRDHSPVGEREDARELSELDAMRHPRRNEVYRDVGSEPHEPHDPDFIDVHRVPFETDAALLLCSDGLTDWSRRQRSARSSSGYAGHPDEIVRALIDAANDAGGKDNVTVVYVEGARFVEGEDTRALRSRKPEREDAGVRRRARHRDRLRRRSRAGVRGRSSACCSSSSRCAAYSIALIAGRSTLGQPSAPSSPRTHVVNPTSTIACGAGRARAGDEIVVEPGEYRERLLLKNGSACVSRVPRGASIRLPGGAAETDAAVIGDDVTGAELRGLPDRRRRRDAARHRHPAAQRRRDARRTSRSRARSAAAIEVGGGSAARSSAATSTTTRARASIVRGGASSAHRAQRVPAQRHVGAGAAGPISSSRSAADLHRATLFDGIARRRLPSSTRIERRRFSSATTGSPSRRRRPRRHRAARAPRGAEEAADDDRLSTRRPLRDRRGDRPRRHGGRLPRQGHAAGSQRRAEAGADAGRTARIARSSRPSAGARSFRRASRRSEPGAGGLRDGEAGRYFFIAMEYVDGENLSDVIAAGRCRRPTRRRVAVQLCRSSSRRTGFEASIDGRSLRSLVHGDLKPRNVRMAHGRRHQGPRLRDRQGAVAQPQGDAQRLRQHAVSVARAARLGRGERARGPVGARRDSLRDAERDGAVSRARHAASRAADSRRLRAAAA